MVHTIITKIRVISYGVRRYHSLKETPNPDLLVRLSSVHKFPCLDNDDTATSWAQQGGYDYYFVQSPGISKGRPRPLDARVCVPDLLPIESEAEG